MSTDWKPPHVRDVSSPQRGLQFQCSPRVPAALPPRASGRAGAKPTPERGTGPTLERRTADAAPRTTQKVQTHVEEEGWTNDF